MINSAYYNTFQHKRGIKRQIINSPADWNLKQETGEEKKVSIKALRRTKENKFRYKSCKEIETLKSSESDSATRHQTSGGNKSVRGLSEEIRPVLVEEKWEIVVKRRVQGLWVAQKNRLELKDTNAKIVYPLRKSSVVCGTEECVRIFEKFGVDVETQVESRSFIEKREVILSGKGKKELPHLKKRAPEKKIIIEAETLEEAFECIEKWADIVQLDKFPVHQIKEVVEFRNRHNPQVKLAATGGIREENVEKFATSGFDFLVLTSVYFSKPIDVKVEITPC